MKKVLILTVTAGSGHNSAAYSMKEKLESVGIEVKVVDILKEYASPINAWVVDKGYSFAVGYLRGIYDFFYNRFLKYDVTKAGICPAQNTVKNINKKLLKEIYEFQPDVIYGTSYYCGMVLANLRRVYNLPSVNIVCMLDYVVSPFWEASVGGVDFITLPNYNFKEELLKKGFAEKNLVCTGIPIGEKFSIKISKQEARGLLGLKDLFTVLIFFGGGHWNGALKVFKSLVKNIKFEMQIVIVNGKNEKARKKVENLVVPENIYVRNLGFSTDIDLIMSASDIMIGKGGGMATTECINKNLPLLATSKLPRQEYYNIKFLEENGGALSFRNEAELLKYINFLHSNSKVRGAMSEKLREFTSNGGDGIFKLITSQNKADYSGVDFDLDYSKVNKKVNQARKNVYKTIRNQM